MARAILTALFGLFASTHLAAAPLDVVRACAAAASPSVRGIKGLSSVCPQLEAALTDLGLNETLYVDWRNSLNVGALQDVIDLAERYSAPKGPANPSTASLRAVLDSLRGQASEPESWWQSLKVRLKKWLADSNSSMANWLKRFLDRWLANVDLSAGLLKALSYSLAALAVIAAIVVIMREFAAVGIGRRKGGRAPSGESGSHHASSGHPSVPEAAARDGVAELLRALVKRLLQTGRLKAERSLTHRELVARSTFDSDAQRAVFAGVADVAESMLYGSRQAPRRT